MRWPDGPDVVPDDAPGAVWIGGHLFDGAGLPIDDAVVETWQPDHTGAFPSAADPRTFRGFGRCTTGSDGGWRIRTVKPGRIEDADGRLAAPYLSVAIFARGLLKPVWTRIYFGDEVAANETDSVLGLVDRSRRRTLVADAIEDGYLIDIYLQGQDETVFFDV
jgi:protocatechuate 3,4-dioxygenase alpha subunit